MPPKGDAKETALVLAQRALESLVVALQQAQRLGVPAEIKRLRLVVAKAQARRDNLEDAAVASLAALHGERLVWVEPADKQPPHRAAATRPALLHGELPPTRQRQSQRARPRLAAREALFRQEASFLAVARANGVPNSSWTHSETDPAWTHSQVEGALLEFLPKIRARWQEEAPPIEAARSAMTTLRTALSVLAIEGTEAKSADAALEVLERIVDARDSLGCETADDVWLLHAERELDDDAIARALWPADYGLADGFVRQALLDRVRQRRSAIKKRCHVP